MSMLAEPKRKQKWTLNPQGNFWKNETNKFGEKMLKRMGWTEGKGLGRNEDGHTSHVKVAFKNDMGGMGFKDTDQPAVHQDEFNLFLKSLNNSSDVDAQPTLELKSLEEKSQNSRARVHYRKFTRGKDLSRCSEKDLANIFGKKKLITTVEAQLEISNVKVTGDDHSFGVKTVTGGSMADYFKNKGKNEKATFISHISENEVPAKKKKRKHIEEECEEEVPRKKHKKRNGLDLGLSNPAFEPLGNRISIEKRVLNTIIESDAENVSELKAEENSGKNNPDLEENSEPKPKKKKKKAINGVDAAPETQFENISNQERPRKKKKSKHNEGIENPSFNHDNVDAQLEEKPEKRKKSKKSEGVENPGFKIENHDIQEENLTEERPKKKKKSKKVEDATPNSDVNLEEQTNEEKPQTKSKQKKKKRKQDDEDVAAFAIDNPTFDINNDTESKQTTQEYEVKRKSKKSKGLDNPALNLNDSSANVSQVNGSVDISDADIMINVVNEPLPVPKPPANKNERKSRKNRLKLRQDLFDINQQVIEGSQKQGQVNHGFDTKAQRVEESVKKVSTCIDHCQAEVENGINESKEVQMVGEVNSSRLQNDVCEDGVVLRFKNARFKGMPHWMKRNDLSATSAKKSYAHLIRGDVVIGFKNSNLHLIDGYAVTTTKKRTETQV